MRQDAKQDRLVIGAKVAEDFRDVGGRKTAEDFAELIEVPLPDQFGQLRLKQTADHSQKSNRDQAQRAQKKAVPHRTERR